MIINRYALDAKFIPLAPFTKRPLHSGWTNNGVDYAVLASYGTIPTDINVGVLTGAESNGLIDIDLDGPGTIEAAAHLLPGTNLIMGRDSRPSSHWFYRISGDTKTIKFHHPITNHLT